MYTPRLGTRRGCDGMNSCMIVVPLLGVTAAKDESRLDTSSMLGMRLGIG